MSRRPPGIKNSALATPSGPASAYRHLGAIAHFLSNHRMWSEPVNCYVEDLEEAGGSG